MIRVVPFGGPIGFSDLPIAGAHFYSQNLLESMMGTGTLYSLQNQVSSSTVSTMGNIKHFAMGPSGYLYAQDNAGHILKEATPGSYDFSIVHSPGGNGAGLMGDQYGNLFYACGTSNNQLGKYDGSSWNDTYQSLLAWQHPMDTYEDLRIVGNSNYVGVLFSDDTWNSQTFSLPSNMTVDAIRSGPTGVLIGANFGQRGAIILWDPVVQQRAKVPWKWTNGNILSIATYGENWIVKTTREVLITNGVTVKQVFTVLDDPLATTSYSSGNDSGLTEQMLIINDYLVFAVPRQLNGPVSFEFGKMKPGLYLYSLSRHTWSYITVPTYNTISVDVYSIFADSAHTRILVGYKDGFTGTSYIATLEKTPPSKATFVSETVGVGRIKYQRVFFGPTDKVLEAAILNLGILNSITDPPTETFDVSMKVYNFRRPLWGKQKTNASITGNNKLQVDGTSTSYTTAQVGDEVTVLEGANAGSVAHISSIANPGTTTETWTLDTTLSNQTENSVHLQVQPFVFVEKKTFTDLTKMKRLYFDVKQGIRGNQFLIKFVIENIGTNLQLEMQTSYWVFNDLGYNQT